MGINTATNDFQVKLGQLVNDGMKRLPVCMVRTALALTLEKVSEIEREIVAQEKAAEEQQKDVEDTARKEAE